MKVLVIGGSGFLGTEIVNELGRQGHEVKSMNRNFSLTLRSEQIVADICNPESYQKEISTWKPEVVIQGAWVTGQSIYRESPLNEQYVTDTLKLAEFCFQSETRHFLVLGSSAEYGVPKEPCNTLSTPTAPTDLYGISKLQTLERLTELAQKYSQRLSWARIFQPYGRNQDSARLIPHAAAELSVGKTVKVSSPFTVLDWISSRDVASAVTFAVQNSLHPIFDIGTSIGSSVLQVLQEVANLLDADPRLLEIDANSASVKNQFTLVVDKNSPLFTAGWRPQDDLHSGLTWALSR